MNVEDAKKNRAALKTYFVKNAIPTEGQFAQFIDSVLNQREDGLVKTANDPLSIEATGDDSSFKKALNFYTRFADPDPAWTVSLRPRVNPGDRAPRALGSASAMRPAIAGSASTQPRAVSESAP